MGRQLFYSYFVVSHHSKYCFGNFIFFFHISLNKFQHFHVGYTKFVPILFSMYLLRILPTSRFITALALSFSLLENNKLNRQIFFFLLFEVINKKKSHYWYFVILPVTKSTNYSLVLYNNDSSCSIIVILQLTIVPSSSLPYNLNLVTFNSVHALINVLSVVLIIISPMLII